MSRITIYSQAQKAPYQQEWDKIIQLEQELYQLKCRIGTSRDRSDLIDKFAQKTLSEIAAIASDASKMFVK
jgi:hypothetical protein